MIGKYIYGIINSDKAFHLYATNDSSDIELVYTIPEEDISAVVSDSEIIDYTFMRKDTLARKLLKHQQVIERIMKLDHGIIPVRLGTFAVDEKEVKSIMKRGYGLIKSLMEKIQDKIEVDVVATWSDLAEVLKEIGEEKEIREFKEKLLGNSKKEVTIDDQMKAGFMIKKALDRKKEMYSIEIQDILKSISKDFRVHELMDEEMVLNSAFLINAREQKYFESKIDELNVKFNETLNFRCVGPLPPYSFYTLEIKKLQFEEIDWARKKLGLLDSFTNKDEIKRAYRKVAFSTHPDKNPETPDIEKEFNDVTKSYKILSDYCLASEQEGKSEGCSFNEYDFKKNAILIKLRD